jgi:FtsP/CotA-like multicopper oxidase with cupredoxin domain
MGKALAFILVGVAVSGALWLEFKPQQGVAIVPLAAVAAVPASEAAATNREQPTAGRSLRREVFAINIQNGKAVSGSTLLKAHEGDEITLEIVSDRSDELHLHGYDLHADLAPGETTTLAFTATRTGRFGMEMHRSHTEVGALEVYPQ